MDTIGPYQLLEELGRGAMGVVFRGYDPNIGRAVAIKIIQAGAFATAEEKAAAAQVQAAGIASGRPLVAGAWGQAVSRADLSRLGDVSRDPEIVSEPARTHATRLARL